MTTWPIVSVLIPARDEEQDIGACLEAIAKQDYPVNLLEVIVIDGASTDRTLEVTRGVLRRYGFGSTAVLHNEEGSTPSNLNLGLARATGEIVCRVDARTRVEPHHVRTCVEVLTSRPDVVVVGGAQVAVARDRTALSVGIARALNNRWSMGGSPYRRATRSRPSDTVYLGAFRTQQLKDAGGWDERFPTNQDFELNRRLGGGGTVWFESSLRSGYLPRSSLVRLWAQYRRFGRAKVRYWRTTGDRPRPRQWALLCVPPVAAVCWIVALVLLPTPLRLALVALTALGLLAVEVSGADEPPASVAGHLVGVGAVPIVGFGWWYGVVTAALSLTGRAEAPVDPTAAGSASEAPPGA